MLCLNNKESFLWPPTKHSPAIFFAHAIMIFRPNALHTRNHQYVRSPERTHINNALTKPRHIEDRYANNERVKIYVRRAAHTCYNRAVRPLRANFVTAPFSLPSQQRYVEIKLSIKLYAYYR